MEFNSDLCGLVLAGTHAIDNTDCKPYLVIELAKHLWPKSKPPSHGSCKYYYGDDQCWESDDILPKNLETIPVNNFIKQPLKTTIMKNPKYKIEQDTDGQYFWSRTAENGEGVAYSLPDRFTQKHTVIESIEADIRSLLAILGFKTDIKTQTQGLLVTVEFYAGPAIGYIGKGFEIEDLTS